MRDTPAIWEDLCLEVEELEKGELYKVRIPLVAKIAAVGPDGVPVVKRVKITKQLKEDICEGFVRVKVELTPLQREPSQKFYHLRRLPSPPPKKAP